MATSSLSTIPRGSAGIAALPSQKTQQLKESFVELHMGPMAGSGIVKVLIIEKMTSRTETCMLWLRQIIKPFLQELNI